MTDVTPPTPEVPPTTPVTPPAAATPPPPAYAAPAAGAPGYAPVVPGRTLGIVALVASFFISILGIILGFVARSQSKAAGVSNTPATVAIILGFVFLVLSVIFIAIGIAGAAALISQCAGLEPGQYTLDNGGTLTCG